MTDTFEPMHVSPEQRQEMIAQIGTMNVLAISGGRVRPITEGIELPVAAGYHVQVALEASDTYRVTRIFRRNGKDHFHGVRTMIYADQVAETAYRASCFRSYDDDEW